MTDKIKCGIYCRVSTAQQGDNYSLGIQEKKGIDFAESQGWEPVLYKDIESGSSKGRKGYKQLIRDINNEKLKAVWVIEFSRLTRDEEDTSFQIRMLFKDFNVRFFSDREEIKFESAEDKLFFKFRSSISSYEKDKIKERMQRGINECYSNGGQKKPKLFGYNNLIDKTVEVNQKEKAWIIEVFERVANDETYDSIAIDFTKRGIPHKKGSTKWTTGKLSKLVRQVAYIGKTYYEDELIDSILYEQIIPDDLWKRVQAKLVLKQEYHQLRETRRGSFELSGLVRCARCGQKYFRKPQYKTKNGMKNERGFYIHIFDTRKSLEICKGKIQQTTVDERELCYLVRAMYLKNFENYEAIRNFFRTETQRIESENKDILRKKEEFEVQKRKLEKRGDKLSDQNLDELISDEYFRKRKTEINNQIKQIETSISELDLVISKEKKGLSLLDDFAEKEVEAFWDLDGNARKGLYQKRIKSITIDGLSLFVEFINGVSYSIENIRDLDEEWIERVDFVRSYYDGIIDGIIQDPQKSFLEDTKGLLPNLDFRLSNYQKIADSIE